MNAADIVDRLLEVPVAPSFTKLGFRARSRLEHWTDLDAYDLSGRTVVVTGATSGLGLVSAETFARRGAHVVVCGRDGSKTERVREQIAVATGSEELTVAVADDVDEIQELVATWLGELGHLVLRASTGRELIQLVREQSIDLVITDLVMPGGDGLDAILTINRVSPGTRILAISGGGPRMPADAGLRVAKGIGADAILLKPFDQRQLLAAVNRLAGG